MSDELLVKLAGQLPKGDANGLDDYTTATKDFQDKIAHRYQPPRVALVIYGVQEAKAGKNGVDSVTYEVQRVEPVTTDAGRRLAEQMFDDEFASRTGQAMISYDLAQLSKQAFADLPRAADQIDEKESRERDLMSPTDELRCHLNRVHGVPDAHLLTAEAADSRHDADHEGDLFINGPLTHEKDWVGWTRADLEEAEIDADAAYVDEPVDGALPLGEPASIEVAMQADDPNLPPEVTFSDPGSGHLDGEGDDRG